MTDTKPAHVARFQIDGKTYTTASLDEITLKDLLVFEVQVRELGLDVTWSDLQEKAAALAESDPDDPTTDRDGLLMMAATIWASRRMAGEDVTFAQAIDVPITKITFLPPTKDHAAGPTRPRKPSREVSARPGPVDDTPPAEERSTSATSE